VIKRNSDAWVDYFKKSLEEKHTGSQQMQSTEMEAYEVALFRRQLDCPYGKINAPQRRSDTDCSASSIDV
jgi:hypothetical protein